MEFWFIALLTFTFSYALGAIPTAVWIAKVMGLPDPRSYGSGNPGATNVLRVGGSSGKKAAILTLIGDAAKGALAVGLAQALDGVPAIAMLGAVLGHCFSFWLKFKGGKGVATAIGVLLVYHPMLAGAALLLFAGVLFVSRMVSLSSTSAAFFAPFMLGFAFHLGLTHPKEYVPWVDIPCLAVLSIVIVFRHRANLKRVWGGTESRLGHKNNDVSSAQTSDATAHS